MRILHASLLMVAAAIHTPQFPAGLSTSSAADLVASIRAQFETRGFSMRARLVTIEAGRETTIQVRALGQRDKTTHRVLYQAIWPAAVKGRAAYIQQGAGQALSGFLFQPPDTVTPLTSTLLSEPFLDTALTIEDMTEDFWDWPAPKAIADGVVEGQPCRIVELRPPPGIAPGYERIRSCLSSQKSLALSIEKIRSGDRIARRVIVKKTIKTESGNWAAAKVLVEDLERKRITTIEVSKGERDIVVSPAEFSIAKIKNLGRGTHDD